MSMLKIDLKEPCYACTFSDIQFYKFSGVSILYCNKMPVCKIVDAYEHATNTKKKIDAEPDVDYLNAAQIRRKGLE